MVFLKLGGSLIKVFAKFDISSKQLLDYALLSRSEYCNNRGIKKCYLLQNVFQIYVIFSFLKWLHGMSDTPLVLLSQVLVCEKSMWGYYMETVNLIVVIMLSWAEMGDEKGCVSTFIQKS